jgi:hypothetical protein
MLTSWFPFRASQSARNWLQQVREGHNKRQCFASKPAFMTRRSNFCGLRTPSNIFGPTAEAAKGSQHDDPEGLPHWFNTARPKEPTKWQGVSNGSNPANSPWYFLSFRLGWVRRDLEAAKLRMGHAKSRVVAACGGLGPGAGWIRARLRSAVTESSHAGLSREGQSEFPCLMGCSFFLRKI